jgi:pyridinium-3,5-biscarboxylic acid mononucleotide sulfurtransferase
MTKLDKLINWFENKGPVLVALSGGVDSALVAFAAFQKLNHSALAITANYKTLAQDELDSARRISTEIGIHQKIINYDELTNENFVINDNQRCYHCRKELGKYLTEFAKQNDIKTIVDGTNLDDLNDYRPGIKAMVSYGIKNPLVETGFSKNDVRREAKNSGLSVYDRPSNSCLASRIPWGQRVTAERLARIEVGEKIVKQTINVKQLRVRDQDGIAKIEVNPTELHLISNEKKLNEIIVKLKQIGFKNVLVDPEGYRSGKLNVITD